MKKLKRALLFALLPCAAMLLLCGCSPSFPIYVEQHNLPDGMKLHMLLKLDEPDEEQINDYFGYNDDPYATYNGSVTVTDSSGNTSTSEDSRKEQEIYNYNEEGWRCADIYLVNIYSNYDTYTAEFNVAQDTDYMRSRFAEEYKTFKIAACSENGDIYKLSNEVVMQVDDKFAYYTEYSYDYESNTLTPTGGMTYFYFENGKKPTDYDAEFFVLGILTGLLYFILLIVMIVMRYNGRNHRSKVFMIIGGVLLLPVILDFIWDSVLYFVPYYDISGKTLGEKLESLSVNIAVLLIATLPYLGIYFLKPKEPKPGATKAGTVGYALLGIGLGVGILALIYFIMALVASA